MVFTSKEKEVNTRPLIEPCSNKKIPCCPISRKKTSASGSRTSATVVLAQHLWRAGTDRKRDPGKAAGCRHHHPPDARFRPGGGRIGYGAGYYDRFLEKNPDLTKIGIAFGCQEMDGLPIDPNDVRMDLIVTEDGVVYDGSGKRHGA